MRPVNKQASNRLYSPYKSAKPDLLAAMGEHCSYCERAAAPQDLHVEHIYPALAHPVRSTQWNNFLVSCNTCNTYKRNHLGDGRQRSLLTRYLWPHIDNTASAFVYKSTGEVGIAANIRPPLKRAAELTREMTGLLRSPASAEGFKKVGIAYDGASKRSQAWAQAAQFKRIFLITPTVSAAATIAKGAAAIGHFSIWMEVFHDQPTMRRELILAFKADSSCFDPATTAPLKKGRL